MTAITIKATPVQLHELENAVKEGYYKSKSDAISEALNLLIKQYKLKKIRNRIMKSREGTERLPSLTEAIIKSHEEEDERL